MIIYCFSWIIPTPTPYPLHRADGIHMIHLVIYELCMSIQPTEALGNYLLDIDHW